jgi:hypothetical protein
MLDAKKSAKLRLHKIIRSMNPLDHNQNVRYRVAVSNAQFDTTIDIGESTPENAAMLVGLAPGSYDIEELFNDPMWKTEILCRVKHYPNPTTGSTDDTAINLDRVLGTKYANLVLAAGDVANCSIINTHKPKLIIEKRALARDATRLAFDFSATNTDPTLPDQTSVLLKNAWSLLPGKANAWTIESVPFGVNPGVIDVAENLAMLPKDWKFSRASCAPTKSGTLTDIYPDDALELTAQEPLPTDSPQIESIVTADGPMEISPPIDRMQVAEIKKLNDALRQVASGKHVRRIRLKPGAEVRCVFENALTTTSPTTTCVTTTTAPKNCTCATSTTIAPTTTIASTTTTRVSTTTAVGATTTAPPISTTMPPSSTTTALGATTTTTSPTTTILLATTTIPGVTTTAAPAITTTTTSATTTTRPETSVTNPVDVTTTTAPRATTTAPVTTLKPTVTTTAPPATTTTPGATLKPNVTTTIEATVITAPEVTTTVAPTTTKPVAPTSPSTTVASVVTTTPVVTTTSRVQPPTTIAGFDIPSSPPIVTIVSITVPATVVVEAPTTTKFIAVQGVQVSANEVPITDKSLTELVKTLPPAPPAFNSSPTQVKGVAIEELALTGASTSQLLICALGCLGLGALLVRLSSRPRF